MGQVELDGRRVVAQREHFAALYVPRRRAFIGEKATLMRRLPRAVRGDTDFHQLFAQIAQGGLTFLIRHLDGNVWEQFATVFGDFPGLLLTFSRTSHSGTYYSGYGLKQSEREKRFDSRHQLR